MPNHPLSGWRCPAKFLATKASHIAEGSVYSVNHQFFGTRGSIRLRTDFFELPEPRQTLTLLHEAIHVALFSGECQDWYEATKALDDEFCIDPFERHHSPNQKLAVPAAYFGALVLFKHMHEIAAEKFLQVNYSSFGLGHCAVYYHGMQEDKLEERSNSDAHSTPTFCAVPSTDVCGTKCLACVRPLGRAALLVGGAIPRGVIDVPTSRPSQQTARLEC